MRASTAGDLLLQLPHLPIARVARGDAQRRVSLVGRAPVWPVASDQEHRALQRLAGLFGASLIEIEIETEIETEAAPGAPAVRDEEVIGLGTDPAIAEAAELYAHLTRRRHRTVPDLAALRGSPPPAVVVTCFGELGMPLFDHLYPEHLEHIPGIVAAADAGALREQVLLRSAASVLRGPVETPLVSLSYEGGGGSLALRHATAAEVRSALARQPAVLQLATHSDGLDLSLGPLTMCEVIKTWSGEALSPGAPQCVERSFCHRLERSMEGAAASGALVGTELVEARIALLLVCSGMLPEGSIVDPRWAYYRRLVTSPSVGCTVTTCESWNRKSIGVVIDGLRSGESIGAALLRYHRSKWFEATGERLCLFGDPDVSVPPWIDDAAAPAPAAVPPPAAAPLSFAPRARVFPRDLRAAPIAIQRASFLRAVVSDHWRADERLSRDYAVQCIDRVLAQSDDPAALAQLSGAVLELFAESAMWSPDRTYGAEALGQMNLPTERRCHSCSSAVKVRAVRFRRFVMERRLVVCWRCGLLEDAPADFPELTVERIGPRTLRLNGGSIEGPWACRLRHVAPERRSVHQPIDRVDHDSRIIELGLPLPERAHVSLYVMSGAQYARLMVVSAGPGVM